MTCGIKILIFLWVAHTVPVLTVSNDSIVVEEGESFSITCTSPDPTHNLFWDYPQLLDFSPENVMVNGSVITVTDAVLENEGRYTCLVLGPQRAVSATADVTVIPRKDSYIQCTYVLLPCNITCMLVYADSVCTCICVYEC